MTDTLHYRRQFLAPEGTHYDESNCISYVHFGQFGKDDIEAEVVISAGRGVINFDGSFQEDHELHLATMTRLRDQLTDYIEAYKHALELARAANAEERESAS